MPDATAVRRQCEVVLELEPEQFTSVRIRFLEELARLAGIQPQDIAVIGVRYGCVEVVLQFASQGDEDVDQELAERLREILEGAEPEAHEFLTTYEVRRYRRRAHLAAAPLVRRGAIPLLAWVHISDIHVRSDDGSVPNELKKRADRLAEELPRCVRSLDLEPSLLLVTGDVAARGKPAEYEAAAEMLESVSRCLPSASTRVFVVPGNHDVDRDVIDPNLEKDLRRRLKQADEESYKAMFEPGATDVASAVTRQAAFLEFARRLRWSSPSTPDYFAAEVLTIGPRDLRVGVALLNSAMLSTTYAILPDDLAELLPDLDRDSLALGEHQLRECKRILADADLRIALMHHPPLSGWFREQDIWLQRRLLTFFDVVLRGHEHEGALESSLRYLRDGPWQVAAPAVDTVMPAFRGFTLAAIDADGAMTAWWWRLTGKADERYVLDTSVTDTGHATVPLGTSALARLKAKFAKTTS